MTITKEDLFGQLDFTKIADNINKQTHLSVYPNPFTTHATLLTDTPLKRCHTYYN